MVVRQPNTIVVHNVSSAKIVQSLALGPVSRRTDDPGRKRSCRGGLIRSPKADLDPQFRQCPCQSRNGKRRISVAGQQTRSRQKDFHDSVRVSLTGVLVTYRGLPAHSVHAHFQPYAASSAAAVPPDNSTIDKPGWMRPVPGRKNRIACSRSPRTSAAAALRSTIPRDQPSSTKPAIKPTMPKLI